MDFVGSVRGGEMLVELKYCERCGGLWLRPRGCAGVHCASCRVCLAAMPDAGQVHQNKASRRKARPPLTNGREERLAVPARIDRLQGVATMEVRA